MYHNGEGVEVNEQEALKWYKKSENGNIIAKYNIGSMYYSGHGIDIDYKEAFKWYLSSAEDGYIAAILRISDMYFEGQGEKKLRKRLYIGH